MISGLQKVRRYSTAGRQSNEDTQSAHGRSRPRDRSFKAVTRWWDEAKRLRDEQVAWVAKTADERGAILLQWADAIEANLGTIIPALTDDTGRGGISKIEAAGVPGQIRRWAEMAPQLIVEGQLTGQPTSVPTITTSTRLVPYQLVGVISPWNFPMTLALIDAIPALMAGSAVLVKPSEVTPRFINPLMETVRKIPELAAVLSIVEGDGRNWCCDGRSG